VEALLKAMSAAAVAVLVLAPLSAASASSPYTFKTRQGAIAEHAHPPGGGVGDTYESSLALRNAGIAQLGLGGHANVGSMKLGYTIRRQCRTFTKSCVATADFHTVTTLPGGTVSADGKTIATATPNIRIPVTGGTGQCRGARGSVMISPSSTRISTYRLTVP
jgi:hypothetical protein